MRVKNIFFLILLFISGNVFGQSWNTITGKSSYTDSARYLKYKGVNNFDSVLYIHPTTGMLLKTVKGLTPSIGVDSITLYFNQLCQWSGGIPTCYFLQPSTFGANDSLHLNFDSTWILHYSNGTLLSDSIYLIHTVLYTDNHFALSPYLAPYTQLLEATRLVDSVYASPFGTSFNYIKYATGHIDSLAAGSGGSSSGLDSTYISSDSLYQIFIYASGRIDTVQWVGDGSAGGGGDGVDSIWRTLGQDSIKFSINGRLRSIKDSSGGGAPGVFYDSTSINFDSTKYVFYSGSTPVDSVLIKASVNLGTANLLQTDLFRTFNQNNQNLAFTNINTFRITISTGDGMYMQSNGDLINTQRIIAYNTIATASNFEGPSISSGSTTPFYLKGNQSPIIVTNTASAYTSPLSFFTAKSGVLSEAAGTIPYPVITGIDKAIIETITFNQKDYGIGIYNKTNKYLYLSDSTDFRRIIMEDANSGVVIGDTTSSNASAILDVRSTTKGFLPPRMTATEGSAISSPAEGLIIYVTNTNGTFIAKGWWGWDGAAWLKLNN